MPELPEVETILQGIKPLVEQQTIAEVIVRQAQLRWKIPPSLSTSIKQSVVVNLTRRGKYIIWQLSNGSSLILHFGMSGFLRIVSRDVPPQKHDHVDIILQNGYCIRYNDARRFGALIHTTGDPLQHPLLKHLGVEPFDKEFNGRYLYERAQNKKISIKQFIMDHQIVVGVGNIYANEALFLSNIHPLHKAHELDMNRYKILASNIKKILRIAIRRGGTTFKDFKDASGKPGYFAQNLRVYGRAGLSCMTCEQLLQTIRIGQRSTVFCPECQQM